jgi:hypothetical protein
LLRLYWSRDRKLTVLRKGIPADPATEVPTRSYPERVVLERPLPWLEQARSHALAGVGSVAAYLALVLVLVVKGRKKTALGLLALFLLLPAYLAAVGLFLVLLLLVAVHRETGLEGRTPGRADTVWRGGVLGLVLLPAIWLGWRVLSAPDLNWLRGGAFWTYPVVLVPLIVLARLGWKKTAVGLLLPCLLLLLCLNWPALGEISHHVSDPPGRGFHIEDEAAQRCHLLEFGLLEPEPKGEKEYLGTLLAHEAWDWSGWYWLWPDQLGSWRSGYFSGNALVWALALAAGAELVRWIARKFPELLEAPP